MRMFLTIAAVLLLAPTAFGQQCTSAGCSRPARVVAAVATTRTVVRERVRVGVAPVRRVLAAVRCHR